MPYIDKDLREAAFKYPMKAGELNYKITRTILAYVEMKGLSYQTINDIIGALESAKAEFQRRVVGHGLADAVETVFVRHLPTGGTSTLQFKSYDQGREAFQGTSQEVIWLDEECQIQT